MRERHPFPAGPDLSAYVPNADVEQCIAYLSAKLSSEPGWVGVCGAPGVGKTLLLRLLLRRLSSRFTPLYVPAAHFTPAELERWIESEAGARSGENATGLATRLAESERPLLLAIDEAQHASHALVGRVEELCVGPARLRAALAWSHIEGEAPPPALKHCPTRVFVETLELAHVPAYVEAQLERVGASDEARALLGGGALDRLALASAGNPRAIQRLADEALFAITRRSRVNTRTVDGTAVKSRSADGIRRRRAFRSRLARVARAIAALAKGVLPQTR
jgi:type II secretory pathway predicted ATPase ExeA